MKSAQICKPEFTKITDGHSGAEGPVFNSSGSRLYMVAPEVEKDTKPAGQVVSVDTVLNKVCSLSHYHQTSVLQSSYTTRSRNVFCVELASNPLMQEKNF